MFSVLEPEVQAPEIYRNTPFEHLMTAEGRQVVICAVFVPVAQTWIATGGTVQSTPVLPNWMSARLKVTVPPPAGDLEQPAAPSV